MEHLKKEDNKIKSEKVGNLGDNKREQMEKEDNKRKKITSTMKKNNWKNTRKKERKLSMIALGMMRKSKLGKW